MSEKVVILGASPKPSRFAYKALVKLQAAGHEVIPVHPKADEIEGIKVIASLSDIATDIDTLTLYIGPARMHELVAGVCQLKPKRVIFNPGTESAEIKQQFEATGIKCVEDCTLVMLDQGRY
ncbi:MAG: CoA-binding protein [Gammaproteobacteria bacterium]|nr:CoA-binding protein [Gammaproteobacteria bacterium]